VTDYNRYWVKEYGSVRGADHMKAEIYKRGPIGCGIDATSALEQYTGPGVFSETKLLVMINHEVSVSPHEFSLPTSHSSAILLCHLLTGGGWAQAVKKLWVNFTQTFALLVLAVKKQVPS